MAQLAMDAQDLDGGVLGRGSILTFLGMFDDEEIQGHLQKRLEFWINKLPAATQRAQHDSAALGSIINDLQVTLARLRSDVPEHALYQGPGVEKLSTGETDPQDAIEAQSCIDSLNT